jgi:transcriptional regulator with XRE-family HTH domain
MSDTRTRHLNLIGPQVRKLRVHRGWTQKVFAAKLQIAGWDISREGVAKVEARMVRVVDHRLYFLANVLGVSITDLLPPIDVRDPNISQTVNRFMAQRF